MQIVPLRAVPNQTLKIVLGGQVCQLNVYERFFGLFMDVYVDETLIIAGVLCQHLNYIVRSVYLGFSGDFVFIDNQGESDPTYDGLGDRYSLAYLEPSELPA